MLEFRALQTVILSAVGGSLFPLSRGSYDRNEKTCWVVDLD